MKLLLLSLLISSHSIAGTIVPNIAWNQIEQNETGSAAALNQRNNASLFVSSTKNEIELNGVDDGTNRSSDFGTRFNISNDKIVIEGTLTEANFDSFYVDFANINAGMLLNEKLAVGISLNHIKAGSSELNTITASGSFNLASNLYLGGGISRLTQNSILENTTTLFIGAGILIDKKTSAEIVLSHRPQESENQNGTSSFREQETEIEVLGTHTLDRVQLSGNLSFTKTKFDDDGLDQEGSSLELMLGAEFLVNKQFAVGGNLQFTNSKQEDNNDSSNDFDSDSRGLTLTARLNVEKFQIYSSLNRTVSGSDDGLNLDIEETDTSFNLVASVFF